MRTGLATSLHKNLSVCMFVFIISSFWTVWTKSDKGFAGTYFILPKLIIVHDIETLHLFLYIGPDNFWLVL